MEGRRGVGNFQGGSSAVSGRDPVVNDLNQKKTGYGGTVVGDAVDI